MLTNSPDAGRTAFGFMEKVQCLTTTGEIMDAMRAVLSGFRCEYLCFNFLPGPTENFEDVLLANTMPAGWLDLYSEKQFMRDDPSMRHCKRMLRPYRWVKESPYIPEQEPRAVEFIQRANDFGLLEGLVIPIASATSRQGHVWIGGRAFDLPDSALPAVYLMALFAFDRVLKLHRPLQNGGSNLTPREREVLTWAALGKTASEIGEILKISQRTAKAHTANARQKLGAVNRTQAVMIALRDRIIQP